MFTCPFCGHSSHYLWQTGHADKVLTDNDVIGGGRRYAKCIRCGSTDRERLVYLFLKNHTEVFRQANATVLHIAPEKSLKKVLKMCFPDTYVRADKFTKGYWYGRDVISMDITAIPFPEATFDLVICNHVLEHITDDRLAIKELYRVLKPGGIAVLQVPVSLRNQFTLEDENVTTPEARKALYGQFDHVRLYGQDYKSRLEAGGFQVSREHIAQLYPDAALNAREVVYAGRK